MEHVERGRRLLLRRAAPARRRALPAEGPLDGGADPAVRGGDAGAGVARHAARLQAAAGMVHRQPARPDAATSPACAHRARASGGCCRSSTATSCAAFCKFMLDESEFLSPYGIRALSRYHQRPSLHACASNGSEHRVDYEPGESTHRPVRRQLQLARADLVSGELPADRVAAEVPPLPRRRLQGRVPHRLGPDDDPVGGRRRALAPA